MDQHLPKLPAELSKYTVTMKLAEGSFGGIYQIRDEAANETLAVRILSKHKLMAGDEAAERARRDFEVMEQVSGAHLLKMRQKAKDVDSYFIVTDYCNKGSLQEVIDHQLQLRATLSDCPTLLRRFAQLLVGYHSFALAGYLHLDIRPAKVLVHDGDFYLAGFGCATPETEEKSSCTSPLHSAPEAISSVYQSVCQPIDSKADIFSLGVLLYCLLFHRLPWSRRVGNREQPLAVDEAVDLFELVGLMQRQSGDDLQLPENPPVPKEVAGLLRGMVVFEPSLRLGFKQVVFHEAWDKLGLTECLEEPRIVS